MPLTDLPYEDLLRYRPEPAVPADLDAFWDDTLAEARAHGGPASVTPVGDSLLRGAEVHDVRFPGHGGEPVAGWLLLPRGARGPLPVVVEYPGYSQGRGLPLERLLYVSAGYAHLVMDTRGQGLPRIDPERVVVGGASQGGGLALAAALVDVPFLQHFPRAVETASAGPYPEIAGYLGLHRRDAVEQVFATLAYVDGLHLAPRATAPALFSAALMDPVCPPSTVFATYHRYGGPAAIEVWRFGDHAGGRASQQRCQLEWLCEQGLGAAN
ncbi:acetylxylan esterase [Kitasatospora sp. NPDC085895]|uniref:acetylxylan esterase n=1 Tax=Kitasatospora sp. NPDC085895 TaxID=3155057 RepID=UPI0034510BC4